MEDGKRKAGAAAVSDDEVICSEALAPGASAQKAEIIALTEALELSRGRRANIYTLCFCHGTRPWGSGPAERPPHG